MKIVVLGPANAGKTSILNRYCFQNFLESTNSTVGASFFTKTLNIDNTEVTVMIWDTAGQERFRSIAPSILRGANGMILVYDVTAPDSFMDMDAYVDFFLEACNVDNNYTLPVLLLGNKSDIPSVISPETIEAWKKKNKVKFSYNVSAKTGENIESSISAFCESLMSPNSNVDNTPIQIVINKHSNNNKGYCCN